MTGGADADAGASLPGLTRVKVRGRAAEATS